MILLKSYKKKKRKWYPSTIWEIFGLTVTANMNQISTPGMSWRNLRLMLAIQAHSSRQRAVYCEFRAIGQRESQDLGPGTLPRHPSKSWDPGFARTTKLIRQSCRNDKVTQDDNFTWSDLPVRVSTDSMTNYREAVDLWISRSRSHNLYLEWVV